MEILKVIAPEGMLIPIDYAIYPSLLDAYLRFKRHDDDETFGSLFDKINGVKSEQTEAQLKGVEFEKCVSDKIKENKGGPVLCNYHDHQYITENFSFNADVVNDIAKRLMHNTGIQKYMEVVIHTHMGNIKLYGIIDFDFPDMIVDLKGTGNYKCNKYKDYTQHPMYSLIRYLDGAPLKQFKYLVSDYENVFQETYLPNQNMFDKLMITIFEFINFVNYYKANITNMKIFGKEVEYAPAG